MNERMDIWRAEKLILLCFLLKGVCCREFSVSLPEKIEALSESCVIIKCTFEIKKDFDQYLTESAATGMWLKDGTEEDTHQVFNSRDPKPNHFNGKITGKLHEKDCTTVFYNVSSKHNGKYYFRIKSGEVLKYTYTQPFSTIDVIGPPPKPRVQLYVEQKEVQGQEEVLEGSSVSLRCSAETLCSSPPPTLTWSSTPRIPLSDSSRLQELISDLNFTATHREHGVTFTCTITYQLQDKSKTAQDSITVHVQYSPKNTAVSVLPSSSVLEGSSVTLICSSDANPAVNYTWSRESEGQLKQLQTGQNLTFNRTDPTHRGWYHCTAQNQHGSQNSSVKLNIQYSPKNISILAIPSSSVLEGSSVTLFCSSDANPAVNYTWSRESEGQLKQLQTGQNLTFNRTDPTHRGWYHCTAQNQHGSQNSSVMLDIQYAPQNMSTLAIPSSSVLEGSSVTLICSSDANPAVIYTWSRESEGQKKQLQTGDTLTFNRTDPTHRGWYHCTAQNQHGSQNSSVRLDIQYASEISPSSSCSRTDVTVCFCETDGNPSPELEWHLSGRPVTNSSNTFISEERMSSTGLRSSITLHQSLTNTSTLQCVSRNTRGTASQLLHLLHVIPQESGFHRFSFLVGAAGGAAVMMILCGILLICSRRENNTRRDDSPGLILNDWEDESGPIYANSAMLSPNGAATPNHKREPLHYASIDFANIQPESEEIRGVSSLTTDYTVIRCYPGGVSEAESSTGGDQPNSSISAVMRSKENETILEQEANIREVFSQQSEDTTYKSINI
ncbi:myelin-associated glycoprotein-like isoform X4 [Cyprinus carpio]|uniref:Myelin-associated glycoprotein-like isoform X4 n=1 Tax=Cyprinus carpio TaxID=7962 RepID=A0A9Q9W788_CYPCA|nr:myelin-associated glycoprotein-like isoform X4 [Cyprinus carpio]